MPGNAEKLAHRLCYAADMAKAREELLAQLGVDLKKSRQAERSKAEAWAKHCNTIKTRENNGSI